MTVYHRTSAADAASILVHGFRDGTGTVMADRERTGVWVFDQPLTEMEGPRSDTLLVLDIPEAVFGEYERVTEGKCFRESLIPAAILNSLEPCPESVTRLTSR
jgi:hypothetical protein